MIGLNMGSQELNAIFESWLITGKPAYVKSYEYFYTGHDDIAVCVQIFSENNKVLLEKTFSYETTNECACFNLERLADYYSEYLVNKYDIPLVSSFKDDFRN